MVRRVELAKIRSVRPLEDRVERRRPGRPEAEQLDRDTDQILVERLAERRVEGQFLRVAGVAEQASVDVHGWEGRRNGGARHDVFGPDRVAGGVDEDFLAHLDVHGGHREADLAGVQPVEIDEPLQRPPEWRLVVERDVVRHPG